MTTMETWYLIVLLGTFSAFAATLAYCTWEQSGTARQPAPAKETSPAPAH